MKSHTPALTAAALAAAASERTGKAQRELKSAEAELLMSNAVLVKALPTTAGPGVAAALQHNASAEEKVHGAAEELEIVKELLEDAELERGTHGPTPATKKTGAAGKSGEGAESVISHLRRSRSGGG